MRTGHCVGGSLYRQTRARRKEVMPDNTLAAFATPWEAPNSRYNSGPIVLDSLEHTMKDLSLRTDFDAFPDSHVQVAPEEWRVCEQRRANAVSFGREGT